MRWAIAFAVALLVIVPLGAGSAVAATDRQVDEGVFTWGVRDSFRDYITGPIANGRITTKDGATQRKGNGPFDFEVDGGTVRDGGKRGAYLESEGTVRFYGHKGELDVTIANPRINVNGQGDGLLTVDHTVPGKKTTSVVMARVTDATVRTSGSSATLRGAKMALTKDGEKIFAWGSKAMYPAGTKLNNSAANLALKKAGEKPGPDDPTDPGVPTPAPSPSPKPTPKPRPTTPKPTTPGTSPTSPGTSPSSPKQGRGGSSAPATKRPAKAQRGKSGQLTWGVKSSFRSYIAGPIANGSATTAGHASQSGSGAYVFPQKSTNAKPPSPKGTTNYRGELTFRGHQHGNSYELDMTLRNPRVVVSSATRAKLVIDTRTTGSRSFRPVTVSNLDLSKGSRSASGGSVSYSNVPVTLSSSGEALFEWEGRAMYSAGTQMDPVSFTIGGDKKVSGSGKSTTAKPRGGSSGSAGSSGSSGAAGGGGADTGPAGTGSAPSASAPDSAGAGSLSWGLRKSFRDYITGPIANGSIAVSGGASSSGNAYTFPQSGEEKGDGGADYRGSVNFRGHGGILDLTLSDPGVTIDSDRRGKLTAEVDGDRITVADLNLGASAKSESDGATVYSDVPATLNPSGAKLFEYNGNSFYPAGTTLDPVTFTVGSASSAGGGGGSSAAPETVASAEDDSSSGAGGSAGSGSGSTPPELEVPDEACVATGSDLRWGFKESFRSYISGSIANGDWTTTGAAEYSTPNFTWPKGTGKFDQKTRTGAVKFPGGIAFDGHDGKLNTTITDPEVRLKGDSAHIVLDTEGATMDAAMEGRDDTELHSDVPFVEIDLSKAKVETKGGKTTITAKDAPTTLTQEGEDAFSQYEKGTKFDPVSFTITAEESCISPDKIKAKGAKSTPKGEAQVAAPSDGGDSGGSSGIPMWAAWAGGGAAGAGLAAGATLLIARRKFAGATA